jgi:hypothetical protein
LDLQVFLIELTKVKNLRGFIEGYFQSHKLLESQSPDEAWEKMWDGPAKTR